MTPVEFQSCIKNYNDNLTAKLHYDYELKRFHAWLVVPLKEGTEQIDFFQFPWEEKEIKRGRVINGKTNSISETKSAARRG